MDCPLVPRSRDGRQGDPYKTERYVTFLHSKTIHYAISLINVTQRLSVP